MRTRSGLGTGLFLALCVGPFVLAWWGTKFCLLAAWYLLLAAGWVLVGAAKVLGAGIDEFGTYRRALQARRGAQNGPQAPVRPSVDPRAHQSNGDARLDAMRARWAAEDAARAARFGQAYISTRR